ncbi:MAG: TolC family protein [Fusobacterium sp.]|nr:TolC family protein [Fusobacterium sp.]
MKFKNISLFSIFLTTVACTNLNNSYEQVNKNFQIYERISKEYSVEKEWWEEYNNKELNNIIKLALNNNIDLKKAAININKALYQANLLGADLIPSFSANALSSASKNIKTGENSNISHSAKLSVSYEIDLWRKLSNVKSAKEWEYKATIEDMEATKLSLVNNVVDAYFNIVYLNNVINITEEKIENYKEINTIIENKYNYGSSNIMEKMQSEQYLVKLENSYLSYKNEKTVQEQKLRDFLNLKPDENIEIKLNNIYSLKTLGVNLDIPVSVIANRPDVRASEHRLISALKNAKASQSNFYPSITLSSSLSSSGDKINNALNVPIAFGSIGINLPFLDWNRIKWNVKIDEASYEIAKLNFEKTVVSSLNEINTYYNSYIQAKLNYQSQEKDYNYQKNIQEHYKNRYENGVSEFKIWLESVNNEKDSEINLIKKKLELIQSENKVYQAMGGKISHSKNLKLD